MCASNPGPTFDFGAFLLLNRTADVFLVLLGLYFIIHLGLQSVAGSIARGEIKESLNETRKLDGGEASCEKKDVSRKDFL